ncbi:MAG: hypothetical protein GWP91_12315, partial [Rhodobacterales bacterium]|nr:hypothetical protein [Rhodobacterales bacterium]
MRQITLLLSIVLFACQATGGSEAANPTTSSDTETDTTSTTTPATDPLVGAACDLLQNPGAESALGDWTIESGDFDVVTAGASPVVPFAGDASFGLGETPLSLVSQSVDLSGYAVSLAENDVVAHFYAQVRTLDGDDEGWLGLAAYDVDGNLLVEMELGPHTVSAWQQQRLHLSLPAGTQSLQVTLGGVRNQGPRNDVYFDELSLCIDRFAEPSLPPLSRGPWLNWVTADAISVLWETPTGATGSVEYGPDGIFDTVADESSGGGTHHEVRLTDLAADTVYAYRVTSGDQAGEIYSFRTAPNQPVPFRFTVWGDNQNGPDVFAEVADRMEALSPDFAVAVGDVVESGRESNYQDELLEPITGLATEVPFLVAAGNHERYFDASGGLFDLHLAQPGDEHCFSWSYGAAFFLFIDTEESVVSGDQLTCINDALASAEFAASDVQFALFHYPPRINYWAFFFYGGDLSYDGDNDVRDTLEPLFEAAGVDLVFNGHNHLYSYTPAGAYSSVAWVTTGGGGGDIDTSGWGTGDWDGMETTLHAHHFLHVSVDGSQIDVEALGVDGALLHTFTVVG